MMVFWRYLADGVFDMKETDAGLPLAWETLPALYPWTLAPV
jgi:hypothetical protein